MTEGKKRTQAAARTRKTAAAKAPATGKRNPVATKAAAAKRVSVAGPKAYVVDVSGAPTELTKMGLVTLVTAQLVEDFSAPEVIEALIEIARYWEGRFKAEGNGEHKGWEVVRKTLEPVLEKLDG
jgi:hypothetical protein